MLNSRKRKILTANSEGRCYAVNVIDIDVRSCQRGHAPAAAAWYKNRRQSLPSEHWLSWRDGTTIPGYAHEASALDEVLSVYMRVVCQATCAGCGGLLK